MLTVLQYNSGLFVITVVLHEEVVAEDQSSREQITGFYCPLIELYLLK